MSADADGPVGVEAYFLALQEQLQASLAVTRVLDHPGAKGDEAELNWWEMLGQHLPQRYRVVSKAFVVDHFGARSQEIDLLLCDRQYSPLILKAKARCFVPAEAVYGVFEVKPRTNREHVLYAAAKLASVRGLVRTSAPITHAGGTIDNPKQPAQIIGGLLTTGSDWADGLGASFTQALADQDSAGLLDLGCALNVSGWQAGYTPKPTVERSVPEQALVFFFLRLLAQLQAIGTAPAMKFEEWSDFLRLQQ